MNKIKWINLALLLTFLLCYLEWGGNQSATIAQTEFEILSNQKDFWTNITHPVILAALLGQIGLLYCILAPRPLKIVNIAAVVLFSLVAGLFFLAGALSLNYKMLLSNLPFLVSAVLFFLNLKDWKEVYGGTGK